MKTSDLTPIDYYKRPTLEMLGIDVPLKIDLPKYERVKYYNPEGKRHRTDGPAEIICDGDSILFRYFINGSYGTIIDDKPTIYRYNRNGELTAIQWTSKTLDITRKEGPALIDIKGGQIEGIEFRGNDNEFRGNHTSKSHPSSFRYDENGECVFWAWTLLGQFHREGGAAVYTKEYPHPYAWYLGGQYYGPTDGEYEPPKGAEQVFMVKHENK